MAAFGTNPTTSSCSSTRMSGIKNRTATMKPRGRVAGAHLTNTAPSGTIFEMKGTPKTAGKSPTGPQDAARERALLRSPSQAAALRHRVVPASEFDHDYVP